MHQQLKKPNSLQGELFETHDMTWSMLDEQQRQSVVELLSELFLEAICISKTNINNSGESETINE